MLRLEEAISLSQGVCVHRTTQHRKLRTHTVPREGFNPRPRPSDRNSGSKYKTNIWFTVQLIERRDRVVNNRATCSKAPGFKSLPEDRLS